MLEIDCVRVAMEAAKPYEVADEISDKYLEMIELATRPRITDTGLAQLTRRRQFLADRHDDIVRILRHNEWVTDDGSVAEAYESVLSQVDTIFTRQQG
jgi:hypothetical protein